MKKEKKETTFKKIYDKLPKRTYIAPKRDWVMRMAALCKVDPLTVRCWLYGTQKPDALKTSILAKELGVPEDELFN